MTTPTTIPIKTQFTSDLTVLNPVTNATTFGVSMADGSIKINGGSTCDLYSNELSFTDATSNQRSRLTIDGLLLYDSSTYELTTSLSSDGAVNIYNGTNNAVIMGKTGLSPNENTSIIASTKSMFLKTNGDIIMYDTTGIIPLIKMNVSDGFTFYNKLYVTYPIIEFLSNVSNESSIKLYNIFSVFKIPYNSCTVSINNNGSIYFKSTASNINTYDTKIWTTDGYSATNGLGILNIESKNFNVSSTDVTTTCNLTWNKLTTNSSDGLNQTILGGGTTYIKLNPLQFTPVANDGSINISTIGIISLSASAIHLNSPLIYGQTSTIISALVNQIW